MKFYKLTVPTGEVVEFIKIRDLAAMASKSTVTLKKWEEKKWLPAANFNMPKITLPDGSVRKGARLYSVKYANQLAAEIMKVKQGELISNDVIHRIAIIFKNEKQEYTTTG